MKISKKKFNFLAFIAEVWFTDSAPEGFREEAVAGVFSHEGNSPLFKIWFRKSLDYETLVHKCWHLFMTMLMSMDNKPHYFAELNDEIYAYSYHTLVSNVLETVTEMKAYSDYFMKQDELMAKYADEKESK